MDGAFVSGPVILARRLSDPWHSHSTNGGLQRDAAQQKEQHRPSSGGEEEQETRRSWAEWMDG